MSRFFPLHTIASAPERSRPVLETLQQAFGAIPGVAAGIANSPVLATGFIGLFRNAHAGTFSEVELQVLLLTNAVTNRCAWAAAFHTALASYAGLPGVDVAAIREGGLPSEPCHAALSRLARSLIERRGQVADADIDRFCSAGFEPAQALEVVGVVAASTITNYAAGMIQPPLDDAFQAHAWAA